MSRTQLPFTIEYALMGLLYQKPIHGYDLYKAFCSLPPVSMLWHIKQSQLYALLEKMEEEGCLTAKIIPNASRPVRKEYRLTEQGKAAFSNWVGSPVEHARDIRQDFMARLYFAGQTGIVPIRELIDRQRSTCQKWQNDLETQQNQLAPEQRFEKLVFSFRIAQVKTTLAWLDICEKELVHE